MSERDRPASMIGGLCQLGADVPCNDDDNNNNNNNNNKV
jgi:hypothetical protein